MKSILIIDDEFGTLDALSAVLEDAGYRVTSARDGQQALRALHDETPDLILLDFYMPVLDGAETLKGIRKQTRTVKTPVVMMSGIPESMVRRRHAGFDAFLRKPFGLDDLLKVVKQLLKGGDGAPKKPGKKKR